MYKFFEQKASYLPFFCYFCTAKEVQSVYLKEKNMINRELIRLKVLQLTYAYYQNNGKSIESAEKELFVSMSKAYDLYLTLLALIVAIHKEGERRYEIESGRALREGLPPVNNRFVENRFAHQLANNTTLMSFLDDQSHRWDNDDEFVKKIYTLIATSEMYEKYITGPDSYDNDKEFWRMAYKTFIVDNDDLDEVLESKNIYWNDDKVTVDTFVLKTIRRFSADSDDEYKLLPEYDNEEDDKEFARKLFRNTLLHAQEYQAYMTDSVQNWDISRFAYMDIIIMQIAIAEMLTFPSIPVNITISIYVDLAKLYSTSKSWKFVNGLLDNIAHKLVEEHKMLKQVK